MRTATPARHGLWVANLTPFRRGAVDTDIVAEHSRWLLSHGVVGLSPTGPAGEFLYLTQPEKQAIYEALTPTLSGRAALWPTVWEPQEQMILDTVRWLAPHDVTGVIVPPPIYYRFSPEDVVWYYRRLADGCPLPIMALHAPGQTHNPLTEEVLRALVVEGLVTGVVDGGGDPVRLDRLNEAFGGQLDIFCCHDGCIRDARARGATGFLSAVGNVFPELVKQVWDRGDADAQGLVDRVVDLMERFGPLISVKYLLLRRGFRFGSRPPFGRLPPPHQQALDGVFQIIESEGFAETVPVR